MTPPFLERETWRTVLVGLCAFPLLASSAALRLAGQRRRADALTSWLRRTWLRPGAQRTLRSSLGQQGAALAISLVVFAVTLYLLIGIVINLAYPLRPDRQATDWGGPSLLGRWAVHGGGGVLFAIALPFISGRLRALAQRVL